jgi:uncharacterized protein
VQRPSFWMPEQLLTSPARGNSFEGFLIEQLIATETLSRPGSGFYYFRTQNGVEIDLLIDRGQERIGIEFKAGVSVKSDDWRHLKTGISDGVIDRGLVVYAGAETFIGSNKISVVPAAHAMRSEFKL